MLAELCPTLWDPIAHHALLFMRFSRQEYCSELSFLPSRDLPDPEIKSACPESPALTGRFLLLEPLGSPVCSTVCLHESGCVLPSAQAQTKALKGIPPRVLRECTHGWLLWVASVPREAPGNTVWARISGILKIGQQMMSEMADALVLMSVRMMRLCCCYIIFSVFLDFHVAL